MTTWERWPAVVFSLVAYSELTVGSWTGRMVYQFAREVKDLSFVSTHGK